MDTAPFHIDLQAAEYLAVLKRLHEVLRPETYLEIGTRSGDSLCLASCASIAIDPSFCVSSDVIGNKPACHFYQIPSDRFFRKHDPQLILGGKVELAFLDGMHLAEFLLRDFANLEKHCRPNSVIVIHDCMPSDIYMACRNEGDHGMRSRSVAPDWWTGDVWKMVRALMEHRPDLRIIGIDSPPTGLICITNLDPASAALDRNYAAILRQMNALGDEEEELQRFLRRLQPIKPSAVETFEDIARHFYL